MSQSKPKKSTKPMKKKKPLPKKVKKEKKFNVVRMGQRIGNLFGRDMGKVGAEAGRLFRQVTGFGDYKVGKNNLLGAMDRLPSFRNMSSGTRVVHREFLNDVITSPTIGAFDIQKIPIQPALLQSFPWLSASAENYQEYTINGMIYEFKSNSYNAVSSTNTASGTVIMATNYNVLDPTFPNKFTMEQTLYTCSSKPSVDLMHPIECAKVETPTNVLFTRSGPVTTGDNRLSDWGNFYIATVGMQGASTNIGELWVTYDITLLKPKLNSTSDVADHYQLPVTHFAPGGANYFGTLTDPPTLVTGSDMGTVLTDTPASPGNLNTIVWPEGYTGNVVFIYRAELKSTVSASLALPYVVTFSGGARGAPVFGKPTANSNGNNEGKTDKLLYNGNGGTTFVQFARIVNGGSISLAGGSTSGANTSGDLIILAVPETFDPQYISPLSPLSAPTSVRSCLDTKLLEYKQPIKLVDEDLMDVEEGEFTDVPPILVKPKLERGTPYSRRVHTSFSGRPTLGSGSSS